MKPPAKPENEEERLNGLLSLEILDTVAEERFDRITRNAQRHFGVLTKQGFIRGMSDYLKYTPRLNSLSKAWAEKMVIE